MRFAITRALPVLSPGSAAARAAEYARAPSRKALAFSDEPAGTWRIEGRATDDQAAEHALEACQVFFGTPCALLAVGERLREGPAGGRPAVRDMPRSRYAGRFDPAMVPTFSDALSERGDVRRYVKAQGAKAAAFHPWGRLFTSVDAPDLRSAEALALAECNADPGRNGRDGLCFLYASGNQVVLPRRATGTITQAGAR